MKTENFFKKRVIIPILLVIALITANINLNFSDFGLGATSVHAESYNSSEYVTLARVGEERLGPSFKGDETNASVHRLTYPRITVKDVAGTVGYCIEPFARGVSPSGQEQTFSIVSDSSLGGLDKTLLGIMTAGYPTVTNGWSADDQYMATQIAIQHFVFQHPDKYPNAKNVKFNNDDWSKWSNEPIIELAKAIYNAGIANPYNPSGNNNTNGNNAISAVPSNSGVFTDMGATLEMTITVNGGSSFQKGKLTLPDEIKNIVKSGKGTITVNGGAVSFKSYILGSADSFEGIEIKPGDTTVKIVLEKESAEAYIPAPGQIKTVKFEFEVLGGNTMRAYKGNNLNSSNQDYIFLAPGTTPPVSGELRWTRDDMPYEEESPGKGALKILKYNKVTNQLVSGAIFEIRGVSPTTWEFLVQIQASPGAAIPLPNGGTARTGVGYIELIDIPAGQYQITEITPPPYYDYCDLGVNSQVVTVTDGEWAQTGLFPQVRFENNPFGTLRIRKIDAVTGNPVNGAIMRIKNALADFEVEIATQNGGFIELRNLPQGNYEITEVFAPNKYTRSTERKTAVIRWGETTDITFENQPKTEVLVKKIDSDTGAALAGAVFRLTKPDTGDVWEEVTWYDGYAVFLDIPTGTYVIEEIKAPTGYVLDALPRTVVIDNDKPNEVIFQNGKKPALIIKKFDEGTGLPLPLAEFRVALMSGQIIYEGITDSNGEIRLEDLSPQWYKITEIAAPPGYLITWDAKDVHFDANQVLEVKFDNRRRPALEILKVDARTMSPLEGAVFYVRKTEDNTVSEYTTDSLGRIFIENLDEAIYSVNEVKAPEGYILNPQHKDIELEWGKTKTLIYENTRKPTLIVSKMNAQTYAPIPNTVYRIEYEDASGGVTSLGTFRTDAGGQIILPKLEPGWYIITEIQAAPGYTLANNPVTRKYLAPGENAYLDLNGTPGKGGGDTSGGNITVFSGNDFIAFGTDIYDYPLNSIVIRKAHYVTGEMLAGAAFEVRKITEELSGTSGTLIGRYTTDGSGVIVITGLQPGGYIVEEVQAPINFLISENSQQQAWLKPDGTSVVEVTFANIPYGSILITKADSLTNRPLPNARFRVTDGSGAVVGNSNGEFVTDVNGHIVVTDVKPGSYVITETEAPEGYEKDGTPQTVNVGADGKVYQVSFKNQPVAALVIRKLDSATKQPLEGAQFKVTTSKGAAVGTGNGIFKTDATGSILISNLPKGVYVAEEIKAPVGYILENQTQTIEIDYGKTYTLDFYNKKMSGLQIIKIDALTKQPLKGASFAVYKQSGELINRYTTDPDGVIIIDTLEPGWYKVVETKTLQGYILDDTPKDVLITDNQFVKVIFENAPMSGLLIRKIDEDTREPLQGAEFTVTGANGIFVGIYRSDADGSAYIKTLEPGWYTVTETKAPDGYTLGDNKKTVEIKHSDLITIEFFNRAFGSLVIKKVDEITGNPLIGGRFSVYRQAGGFVGEYATGSDGTISIPSTEPGWYVVSETKAPIGYTLDNTAKTVEVKPVVPTVVTFTDKPLSGFEIIKTDAVTRLPLAKATFTVERANGERVGTYKTDVSGKIIVSDLAEGTYVVSETAAPDGYVIDETPKNVNVISGRLVTVEFTNKPLSGVEIIKLDSVTKSPLANASFLIQRVNGERVGTYKTDATGKIIVSDLAEGTYVVSETAAPDGYVIDETPKNVNVISGRLVTVEFYNKPLSGIEIIKLESVTKSPLANALFLIQRVNGERVGIYKTDTTGKIIASDLTEGTYVVSETAAPDGYMLDETPKNVSVVSGRLVTVEFFNKPLSGIEIIKLDSITKAPLSNASFLIQRVNGERIGTYKTDTTGKIIVSDLSEGIYVVSETAAPDGYILDEAPKNVTVKSGVIATVEFFNKPLSGLKIIKLNSENRSPIANVEFVITKMNGEKVTNEFNGSAFKTDGAGQIYIPNLENGYYTVTETKQADGYLLDGQPKTVLVESGKPTVLEVFNTPMSGLLIVKTDANTGEPLSGVVFDVRRADGQFVSGSILDANQPNTQANSPNKTVMPNGDITGSYTTDANGRILINTLPSGEYHVIERKALDGYELDKDVHAVTVTPGKLATLQLTNKPKAGLRVLKIDAISKTPIYGVEFMVFDSNGNVVGRYITDNNGIIDFTGILSEGRYTIRETKAAPGYYLDEIPKTIEFIAGKITEIRWENTPQMAQIQITKKSGDDNEINGLPKGSPLAGAVFEAYAYKSGNIVDRFISGGDGRAVSRPLPLGRYIIKEVEAPQWYRISDQTMDVDLEFATQIIKTEFLNYSANTGVTIRKTGSSEVMPNDTVRWDIRELRNTSTVPLTDFYWRDMVPTSAVRLTKIVTGSFNQSLKYKIMATTNKGDNRVIADNLSTMQNNVVDCSNASLGLASDEYVTSFTAVFGVVKAGFSIVEQPQIYAKVLPNLPNGFQFANKVDTGGKYGREWVSGNATWLSAVYAQNSKLPRTGY